MKKRGAIKEEALPEKKWNDLSDRQKTMILTSIIVQVPLLLKALTDMYRRPAVKIRGKKWAWAAFSFVNFVGPISYFLFGHRRRR